MFVEWWFGIGAVCSVCVFLSFRADIKKTIGDATFSETVVAPLIPALITLFFPPIMPFFIAMTTRWRP